MTTPAKPGPEGIPLGLDLGSLSFRAAYSLGGEVINVPMEPGDPTWHAPVIAYLASEDSPRVAFTSLKQRLGTGRRFLSQGRWLVAEDCIRDMLLRLRATVVAYTGLPISSTAIAIPAHFSASQRAALQKVAHSAELPRVRFLHDSTAAALGYTLGCKSASTLLVYSMGFQGAACAVSRWGRQQLRELAFDSRESPGGCDIDAMLVAEVLLRLLQRGVPLQPSNQPSRGWIELQALCMKLKHELGAAPDASVELPSFLTLGPDVRLSFVRDDLDRIVEPLAARELAHTLSTLADAGVRAEEVDHVLLLGGSTRLRVLRRCFEARFGARITQPRENLLAQGAAVHAALADGSEAPDELTPAAGLPSAAGPASLVVDGPLADPDLEPIMSYIRRLVQLGRADAATVFVDDMLARARALLP